MRNSSRLSIRSPGIRLLRLPFWALLPAWSALADEALFDAARKGDVATVRHRLAAGVDVNAKTPYGGTALSFACDRGLLDVVRELLAAQAEPDVEDTFYRATPMTWALRKGYSAVAIALLEAGSKQADDALLYAAVHGNAELARAAILRGTVTQESLDMALAKAQAPTLIALLTAAGAKNPSPARLAAELAETTVGKIGDEADDERHQGMGENRKEGPPTAAPGYQGVVKSPDNWPQFRGVHANGVADGQFPPTSFDGMTGVNVRFRKPIPGLGHSCPVVSAGRIYLTTAISEDAHATLKPGQYEDVTSVEDKTRHVWKIYAIDAATGADVWERTACEGVPQVKRHPKGSHASPTVATDGRHVVANFGAEGLFCYDAEGRQLWRVDLGKLDSGWFYDADYQWGFGSSPVIWRDRVFVQCDVGHGSYLAAYALADGRRLWHTSRDEIPSWGTPTVVASERRTEVVTNATRFARGYDPDTGRELWRLGKHAEITVPTPFAAKGLVFITSGYSPIQPIYAIKAGFAEGDITPGHDSTAHESIAWSRSQGGSYLPTPIAYGDYLYVCSNTGLLDCYELSTGKKVYRQRLGGTSGYTASPVAADGRLYFAGEDGVVRVVQAGPKYALLATNSLGDVVMATPAISGGTMYVRGEHFLFGLKTTKEPGEPHADTTDKP